MIELQYPDFMSMSPQHDAPSELLLIVVGANLDAERRDRPLGYRLREQILRWQDERRSKATGDLPLLQPIVCTDLWYLNDDSLRDKPVIALGDPSDNAAAAALANRLPTAFVIEHTLRVHMDLEFIDLQACLWGVNPSATVSAVDLFVERYLDDFLREAVESLA